MGINNRMKISKKKTRGLALLLTGMLATWSLFGLQAANAVNIFRPFVVTSATDLSTLMVGDTFTVDVAIDNLPAATDYDVILNMAVGSIPSVFGTAFNLVEHFPGTPTLFFASSGGVNMILTQDPAALSGLTPVLSFDLMALSPGSGIFSAAGFNILEFNNGVDTVFTNADTLAFQVFRAVPEPGALGIMGLGLAGLGFLARRKRMF